MAERNENTKGNQNTPNANTGNTDARNTERTPESSRTEKPQAGNTGNQPGNRPIDRDQTNLGTPHEDRNKAAGDMGESELDQDRLGNKNKITATGGAQGSQATQGGYSNTPNSDKNRMKEEEELGADARRTTAEGQDRSSSEGRTATQGSSQQGGKSTGGYSNTGTDKGSTKQ